MYVLDNELEDILLAFGIEENAPRLKLGGLTTENIRIRSRQGQFVAKIYRGAPEWLVERGVEVNEILARHGIPVPLLRSTGNGEKVVRLKGSGFAILMEMSPGSVHHADALSDRQLFKIGLVCGEMEVGLFRECHLLQSLDRSSDSARKDDIRPPVRSPEIKALQNAKAFLLEQIANAGFDSGALERGWQHGDFHNENVIISGDEVTAVLDFDNLRVDTVGADVANFALIATAALPLEEVLSLGFARLFDGYLQATGRSREQSRLAIYSALERQAKSTFLEERFSSDQDNTLPYIQRDIRRFSQLGTNLQLLASAWVTS